MLKSASSKNSLFLMSEKVYLLGLAFLINLLLARLVGPEQYGKYAYVLSFASLFLPLCVMGVNNIASKYFVKYPNNSHHYLLSSLAIRCFGAILSLVIAVIILTLILKNESDFKLILILITLQCFTLFNVIEFYFLSKNQAVQAIKVRVFAATIISAAKIFIIMTSKDITLLVIVHGFEFVLIAVGYLYYYYFKGHQKFQKKSFSVNTTLALFHKSKWLLFSGLASILYLKIDQIMLANMHSIKEVGLYAAAVKISELWYVFPVLIANAYNAQLIKAKKKSPNDYQQLLLSLLSRLFASAIIISITIYLFSKILINVLYGEEFLKSATFLSIHIFATLFIFQRAILSKWLIIESLYKFSLVTQGAGATINIVLNYFWIPTYGGQGAAWATLISYTCASFLSLLFTSQTRSFMKLMLTAMIKCPILIHKNYLK